MPECIRIFLSRLAALFRRGYLDEELDKELGFHLEMQIRANLGNGMNQEKARCDALRSIGGMDQIKEVYRDRRGLRFLEDFLQDLRYGFHILCRNPLFGLAAVLTLALGIGANTAIFSVVNAVLLHPLHFFHPEELVLISANRAGGSGMLLFGPEFQEFYRQAKIMPEIAAYGIRQANMSGGENAERVMVGNASTGFFPLLGVRTQIGRNFISGEDQAGAGQVAILSDHLWKSRFGGDPTVLGRFLSLDGAGYAVIGILPASFDIPGQPQIDLWTPAQLDKKDKYGQALSYTLIGRLKPIDRIQAAQAELDRIYQTRPVRRRYEMHVSLSKWEEEIAKDARLPLFLFLGTVWVVLLISCANIANLLLARAATREKEMAIRAALGARRLRIVRQLLTESLLIALLGGGLGFAATFWAARPLSLLVSNNLVRIPGIPIDQWVLSFALLISLATALAVGIAPALQISRVSVGPSLNEGNRSTSDPGFHRTRRLFVALEIALVVVLLVGAGLLLKTLLNLQQINPGFQPGSILSMYVDLTPSKYPTARSQAAYFEQALERLKTVPGIESVGANACLPFGNFNLVGSGIEIEGLAEATPENELITINPVSDGYCRTLHIPLLHGRSFTSDDRGNSAGVAIIDDAFAHRYFPNRDPVGRQIKVLLKRSWTIVGVVGDVRQYPIEKNAKPQIYIPYLQSPYPIPFMSIVARCARDPIKLGAFARDALKNIDPDQPAFDIKTLEDRVSGSLNKRKINSTVVGSFAALALLLAFIGIYGVVSFSVSRRTHEIGVRLALGADKSDVLRMILKDSMGTCIVGLLLGTAWALAATRVIATMLYGVSATDGAIFITALLFVAAVVLLASYIPARKAAMLDPARSLRYE